MSEDGAAALAGLMGQPVPRLSGIELAGASRSLREARSATGLEGEPAFDAAATADIQGNVVPGFNKDHQRFLFLAAGEPEQTRGWLRWLAPQLASMQEVLDFRREFRRERLATGRQQPSRSATWVSLAVSAPAITTLLGEEALAALPDEAFRQGLAARSAYLGDPAEPGTPGHRDRWVVSGPATEADFLVIVAADSPEDLAGAADRVLAQAAADGLRVVFDQECANLPGALAGHEHFGFKDGVSQPGVRGTTPVGEPVTPRHLHPDDPHAASFARAGQPLVWPGQFVCGWPRTDPADPRVEDDPAPFPDWARNGSFLVCRRLAQDVPAFWDFAAAADPDPVRFAARLVGRWPSGAPVSRSPEHDDLRLAGDEFANNHFLFEDDTRPWTPSPELEQGGYAGDDYPRASADGFGDVCPWSTHIRKVNPRDSGTDLGAPADTFARLLLRRGIPYGPALAGVAEPSPELVAAERGLMFVAYQTSVEDQFELVTRRWVNSTTQPNVAEADPLIGPGRPWVVPTGGGYFFAPAISAVAEVLGGAVSRG